MSGRPALWRLVAAMGVIACSAFGGRALAGGPPSAGGEPFPSVSPEVSSGAPSFSVDPSEEEGRPGDPVRMSFAVNDDGWAIDGCSAGFEAASPTSCDTSGLDPFVELRVPPDAAPGSRSISWTISYYALPRESGADPLVTTGSTSFVVLPPVVPPPAPSGPGESAGSGGGSLVTEPPAGVEQPRSVPTSSERSLPIGVPLMLVVLAAGGIVVALVAGRKRAGAASPAGDGVRVVPHFESGVQVTVREAHRSLTNVVRLEPRSAAAVVDVREERE